MSRVPFGLRYDGEMRLVRVIYGDPAGAHSTSEEVEGRVELSGCYLPSGTKVAVGDVLEYRAKRNDSWTRKVVTGLNEGQKVVHVTWTSFAEASVAHQRCLKQLAFVHSELRLSVSSLFADGHYSQAVFEATKLLETRVRMDSGLDASGRTLMGKAFDGDPAPVDLRRWSGVSGDDEQAGLRFIFMGTMQAIRNPRGHELTEPLDPQEAFEYLSLVSLLLRRLDAAPRAANGVAASPQSS